MATYEKDLSVQAGDLSLSLRAHKMDKENKCHRDQMIKWDGFINRTKGTERRRGCG